MTELKYKQYEPYIHKIQESFIKYTNAMAAVAKSDDINEMFEWLEDYITMQQNPKAFNVDDIGDLKRGQVVLIKFGTNIGKEFTGKHPGVLLRDCRKGIDQLMVLPLTSKKPKKFDPTRPGIYLEIPKTPGLKGYQNILDKNDNDNGKHWANILSIRNISKQRIIYPPEPVEMEGKILNKISGAIQSQIALR